MRHDELKEKILGLYDGPVTEKERVWVETHLSSCVDCSRALSEYQKFSAHLFATPTYSEAEEDMFTEKVMMRVRASALAKKPLTAETVLRWFLPLVGSTVVAAWVFFSVLPNTPEFSADNNGPSYFTSEASLNVNALAPVSSKPSNEEMVVSWMRE
jgi:hypothetical protein